MRLSVIIVSAILVGVITAFCGPIAFVGISVPIASRLFFKTSHHLHQMTFCLLLGACVVPVSYTHLDVYKRQQFSIADVDISIISIDIVSRPMEKIIYLHFRKT